MWFQKILIIMIKIVGSVVSDTDVQFENYQLILLINLRKLNSLNYWIQVYERHIWKIWEKNFKTVMEGKLRTYCKIQTSFGSEKYLHLWVWEVSTSLGLRSIYIFGSEKYLHLWVWEVSTSLGLRSIYIFGSEKYLHILNNFTLGRAITKLKIFSHRLKIETGRYFKLEVNKRLCK